jgi:hypothetical protein
VQPTGWGWATKIPLKEIIPKPPEKLVKGENGSCAMLEMFSRNLDCSVHSLNELCPLEAQEAVVGIQVGQRRKRRQPFHSFLPSGTIE